MRNVAALKPIHIWARFLERRLSLTQEDDLSVGKGALLSDSFGVLLVGSRKKIAKTKF